jgi:polyisoprenoid-binding protein YceI
MRWLKVISATFLLALPGMAATEIYQIDPVHSEVSFHVRHLGLSKVYGRFVDYKGTILLDGQDASKSSVNISIDASSINTENSMRDKDLRSSNFFDTGNFPTVTFQSVAVKGLAKDKFEVTGDLSIHGVTKRITIPITATGTMSTPREVRAGFEGSITLSRYDYGISFLPGVVGEEVSITLGIEAVRSEVKP